MGSYENVVEDVKDFYFLFFILLPLLAYLFRHTSQNPKKTPQKPKYQSRDHIDLFSVYLTFQNSLLGSLSAVLSRSP